MTQKGKKPGCKPYISATFELKTPPFASSRAQIPAKHLK